MIDRNSQFMAILTNVGAAKLANANALGIPWNLTALGVGDANGTDPVPSATQTKLINEQRRAPLNQLRVDPVNAAVIIAEQVIPADVGGWWIREIGLYDSDGDLVAVSNCAPSFKPALDQGSGRTQIVRMNFIVSSINNIVLKIDPAIVLATREYVDLAITEAVNKQDSKHSVLVATTANIALNGIQTIDGVLLAADARVLVKDQVQAKDNGIYVVPANGAWKRAQDADASIEVTPGLFVTVEKGTANGDSIWQLVTDAPIILGTTALTFEVIAGRTGIGAGTYRSLTVDKLGRVIAGTNPTTLAGSGITDGATKTELSDEVAKLLPRTGAKVSGSFTLDGGTEDSPQFGFKTPTAEAYIDLCNKSVRIFARNGEVNSVPLNLNLESKVAEIFGRVVWDSGNFDPTLKAAKATTLAGYNITDALTAVQVNNALSQCIKLSQFVPSGSAPVFQSAGFGAIAGIAGGAGTVQVSGGDGVSSAVMCFHRPGNYGVMFGLDTDNQLKLGGWSAGAVAHTIWHSGNRPKNTALLAPTGWRKDADTGEIIQWLEYSFDDMPTIKTISVTWPFQFPTQFINAKVSFRKTTAAPACIQGYYSAPSVSGCTVYVEEWSGVTQTGITVVVEARGF
ncbi:phage tail protein [Pseudomonas sp. RA_5y_Pfl1_P24]|uniref:phage tail protein n=1 Tax=Pseudomonas sp. RA_5y_Pfl1_P24 TaxID=3088706 RepID=UPI0030DC214D